MMKKLLSYHSLGILLSAAVLSSLLTTGIWWKVLIIGLVFTFQKILEEFECYSYLQWNREGLWFSKPEQDSELIKNIWFSGVKTLSALFIIGCGLHHEKHLTITSVLILALVSMALIFLYFGKKLSPTKEEMAEGSVRGWIGIIKKIITILLIFDAIFLACLNFGTGYVWLSSFLALMLFFGLMINDLVGEVEFEKRGIKKVIIIVLSILPFLICIISTIYQFWHNIWNWVDASWFWILDVSGPACDAIAHLLTNRIGSVSVWLIFLILLALWGLIIIFKELRERSVQNKKDKIETKEIREKNIKIIIYSLANDEPISKEYLVYLAKNQDCLEGFPLKKLVCLNLKKMFLTISDVKKKMVWDHDLEEVLRMYNSWFKRATDDGLLLLLMKAVVNLHSSTREYKDYSSFNAFERMLSDTVPYILTMAK